MHTLAIIGIILALLCWCWGLFWMIISMVFGSEELQNLKLELKTREEIAHVTGGVREEMKTVSRMILFSIPLFIFAPICWPWLGLRRAVGWFVEIIRFAWR